MTAKDDPTPVPHPVGDGDAAQQILWAVILLAGLVAVFYWTSAPPPENRVDEFQFVISENEPTEQSEQSEEPDLPLPLPSRSEAASGAAEAHVEIQSPADQQSGWLRITGLATDQRKSSATGHYRRNNEFDIDTANVDRLEVRLADLNVNRTRRFIFHIDGQDMLVFVNEIGTISFVRSPEGLWARP